jgi:hypothetical protein
VTRRSARPLAIAVAAIICLSNAAVAQACGGTIAGPVVAHGSLPGHQRWFQRACLNGPRQLLVDLDLPQPGGYDGGGGMGVPFPLPADSLFIDAPYEGYGSARANGITGVTSPSVRELRVDFRTGPPLFVRPILAPKLVRNRHPYLQRIRFFVIWYDGARGVPDMICGLTARQRPFICRRRGNRSPIWQPVDPVS